MFLQDDPLEYACLVSTTHKAWPYVEAVIVIKSSFMRARAQKCGTRLADYSKTAPIRSGSHAELSDISVSDHIPTLRDMSIAYAGETLACEVTEIHMRRSNRSRANRGQDQSLLTVLRSSPGEHPDGSGRVQRLGPFFWPRDQS